MIPFFHGTVDLSPCVLIRRVLALIVQLFASTKRDFYLDTRVFQINGEGNDGIALQLDLGIQPHDFSLMQEQSTGPQGVLIKNVTLLIGADVHLSDPQLAILDGAPSLFEIECAETNGLYLRARQLDSRLEAFFDKVFMKGLGVFAKIFTPLSIVSPPFLHYITSVKSQTGSF